MNKYQRWRQGMKELTPEQFAKAKVTGHFWAVVGLCIGGAFLISRGYYAFLVFILAIMWLQIWEYKAAKKNYQGMKKLREEAVAAEIMKEL